MLGLPYPLKTVLHEMQRLFIPFGLCSNLLNEVKMYVKARYFLILVLDIIGRIEKTLGDDANEKNYQKAKAIPHRNIMREILQYSIMGI